MIVSCFCQHVLIFWTISSRHKKKKIPLMTGEEVDMDLNAMEWVLYIGNNIQPLLLLGAIATIWKLWW